ALLWEYMPNLNWAGFYKMTDGKLVLGPFQGKTACIVIEIGRGVCGTAVFEDKTQLVYDVHQFPGHIACDCASNSEIVVPIHKNGKIWGVLDIDSPITGRFSEKDKTGLEEFVKILEKAL
ncbi:MAG: GAF domain-containing protein, partial [Oscillospiraceae bacterium]|nr:GAF domain-containing protein [Oscillospiraceae bacterium]